MPSVDTNILLRLILRDNKKQLQHIQNLLIKHDEVMVADQTIIEVVYVLSGHYQSSRQRISAVLDGILHNSHFVVSRDVFERVQERYSAHPSVSFTDIYLEARAHFDGNMPLYTVDKKLAKQLPQAELVK